jgi:predicted enzyme related to lactoylglutathione lyase
MIAAGKMPYDKSNQSKWEGASMTDTAEIGQIGWIDISIDDAAGLSDFYSSVVGWKTEAQSMGDYSDFTMLTPDSGSPIAGVCHARGSNADMPRQWLIYITVADVDASAAKCTEKGGKLLVPPKAMGNARFCVIEDPAGAVAGLYQAG